MAVTDCVENQQLAKQPSSNEPSSRAPSGRTCVGSLARGYLAPPSLAAAAAKCNVSPSPGGDRVSNGGSSVGPTARARQAAASGYHGLTTYDGKFSSEAEDVCRRLGLSNSKLNSTQHRRHPLEQHAKIVHVPCTCKAAVDTRDSASDDLSDDVFNPYPAERPCTRPSSPSGEGVSTSCLFTNDGDFLITARLCCVDSPRDHLAAFPIGNVTRGSRKKEDDVTISISEARSLRKDGAMSDHVVLATVMLPSESCGYDGEGLSAPLLASLDDDVIAYVSRNSNDVMPLHVGSIVSGCRTPLWSSTDDGYIRCTPPPPPVYNRCSDEGECDDVGDEKKHSPSVTTSTSTNASRTKRRRSAESGSSCYESCYSSLSSPSNGSEGNFGKQSHADDVLTPDTISPLPWQRQVSGRPPLQQQHSIWRHIDSAGKLIVAMEARSIGSSAASVSVFDVERNGTIVQLGREILETLRHNMTVLGTKALESDQSSTPTVPVSRRLSLHEPNTSQFPEQVHHQQRDVVTTLSSFTSAALSPNCKQLVVTSHSFIVPSVAEECSAFMLDLNRKKEQVSPLAGQQFGGKADGLIKSPNRVFPSVQEVQQLPALCVRTPNADTSVSHMACIYHPSYCSYQKKMYGLPELYLRESSMRRRKSDVMTHLGTARRSGGGGYFVSPAARQRRLRRRSSFSDVETVSASLQRQAESSRINGSVAVLSALEKRSVLRPDSHWIRVMLLHVQSQTVIWERVRTTSKAHAKQAQLSFTPDGQLLAVLAEVSRLDIHSTADGSLVRVLLPGVTNRLASIGGIVFSTDQRHIAGIANGKDICVWRGTVASLKHLSYLVLTRLHRTVGQLKQGAVTAAMRFND